MFLILFYRSFALKGMPAFCSANATKKKFFFSTLQRFHSDPDIPASSYMDAGAYNRNENAGALERKKCQQ
jgi:hypothetical protein